MRYINQFTIEDQGRGLVAVFKTDSKPSTTVSFNEKALLSRIERVVYEGKSASLEKTALYALQRLQQKR